MSGVQSVDRAFSLLGAVAARPAGLTELARRVDLPLSTASRLLATLEQIGAVERVNELGIFRIGPVVLTLASSADSSRSLKAVARPELEFLMRQMQEAAGLSVAAGYTMHYLDQVDSEQAVQVQDWVNTRLAMHLVSSGLVVLANWPTKAVDNFLDGQLETPTANTIHEPGAIRERLESVRADGFAWTMEELAPGINSVAAPIFSVMGDVVGAIHLHGPAFRFPQGEAQKFEEAVVGAAGRVAQAIGLGPATPDVSSEGGVTESETPGTPEDVAEAGP